MENFYEYIIHIIRSILRFHYYCEHDCCHDRIDGIWNEFAIVYNMLNLL